VKNCIKTIEKKSMPRKTNQLPYFNTTQNAKEKEISDFLLRKFRSKIRNFASQHYLVQHIPKENLKFIRETSKTYPYFLRIDIQKYFPSITHQILLDNLPIVYQKLTTNHLSRQFKKYVSKEIPAFLEKSPYKKGLPIGSRLSYILAGIFLLGLDIEIKSPFLRQTDDYLIFCKNKKEPEQLLKNIITPKLQELGLEINEKKLISGKFHQNKVSLIGFEFYANYFRISEKKVEEFKQRIIKITHLTKKKPKKAVIKLLNNQIFGFGHYYKHASCRRSFRELDSFIRMRLRRYITRNKDSKMREGNIFLTNYILQKEMGLKSLSSIKQKYDKDKSPNKQKNNNQGGRSCKSSSHYSLRELKEKAHYYEQNMVLKELKSITSSMKKLEKRISKIEKNQQISLLEKIKFLLRIN
jgi:hypothetical protein